MPSIATINRSKTVRFTINIVCQITSLPLLLLGWITPKQKNTWIFGNTSGDKDNSYYLFEYVQENRPEITAIWISKNNRDINKKNTNAYYYFSLRGIFYQYIAKISVHTTGMGDFFKFTRANKYRVQLWHGIPIKKILLDSKETLPGLSSKSLISKLSGHVLKRHLRNNYHLIIASSPDNQKLMMSAFNQPAENVAITGYPRQDIINKQTKDPTLRILYAPTWRANNQTAIKLFRQFFMTLKKHHPTLKQYDVDISLHPLNKNIAASIAVNHPNATIINDTDINMVLGNYSTLITDYSSIAIDFLPLKRKLFFFTPDLEDYGEGRGLYPEFIQFIEDNQLGSQGSTSAKKLSNHYFSFSDNNNCRRITERIQTELNT